MKIYIIVAIMFFASAGTAAVFAQDGKKPTVAFDSAYTNLAKNCKVLKCGSGQDDASLCEGIGGYSVRIYSSAAATHIVAELKGSDDTFPIATVGLDFNATKGKIEWRTAGGRPFAIIMRVPKYGATSDDNPYIGKLIGEELVVVGLKNFETLGSSVDAKTPNANAEARGLADKSYAAAKVK
jgi:hypothetical protein